MATRIRISTTFDCTTTGVTGNYKAAQLPFRDSAQQLINSEAAWLRSRNQQRNYETLMQIVNLYTQPMNPSCSEHKTDQWSFEFDIEFDGVFSSDDDSLGLLKAAATGVPMLDKLDSFQFVTTSLLPNINVFFEEIENK
jgi:hypothetical protein